MNAKDDNLKNNNLTMFLCVTSKDIEKCWEDYGEDSYKILFFVKGGLPLFVNGDRLEYNNKTVVFLRSNDRCAFAPEGEEENEVIVHTECYAIFIPKNTYSLAKNLLNGDKSFRSFERGALPKIFELDDIQADKLTRELNDFYQSGSTDEVDRRNSMKLLMAELYYAFVVGGYKQMHRFADAPKWFNEYYSVISKPEVFTMPFEKMISLSGRTREHLSRVFRRVTGTVISEFVLSKRINYACTLLRDDRNSISDVIRKSGFKNVGTFYTNFKKKTGQSPERYRKAVK